MRATLTAILIAVSLLTAAPALAASDGRGFIAEIPRDFMTGAAFYFETVGGWIGDLLSRLGLLHGSPNRPTAAIPAYGACRPGDLCATGTTCTDICPDGAVCETPNRCMPPPVQLGHCAIAADCRDVCRDLGLPPIGPAAFLTSCVKDVCRCAPIVITPTVARTACPDGLAEVLACPVGTHQACAASTCPAGDCPAHATCLTDPAYGGACVDTDECASVTCAENAAPFCDTDQRCKCRKSEKTTIACANDVDCGGVACAADEIASCHAGACACVGVGATTACSKVEDCSTNCPQGYSPACELNSCVCQRTQNIPVACTAVTDCGAVNCPTGYDKACLASVCACTRTFRPQ